MQLVQTIAAAALFLAAAATPFAVATADVAEPKEVKVTKFHTAVVVTSVADKRNYANEYTQPICVTDVTRVREAVFNGTRDMYIEVNGCSVTKPRGLCGGSATCKPLPFEVNLVGPVSTPGFDPVLAMERGTPVKSPYVIRSIGLLI
jgi:hypothetical protein